MAIIPIGIDVGDAGDAWPIQQGNECERLDTFFREAKGLDDEARRKIFATAAEILIQCPNPLGSSKQQTGLVLGKVQSGKTSQFIALSSLALDNGYRIVILLGGRTNGLLGQNNNRIWEYLDLFHRSDKVCPFVNPTTSDAREISAVLRAGNVVVITVLKHAGHIGDLGTLFESPEIRRYPTLIIDDEGDQASLNTKAKQGKRSSTYNAILRLRSVFPIHAYIATTATPQANLLIKTWDNLSPEFCVLVEPGRGYCGGSTFFGVERDRFIRPIDDREDPEAKGTPVGLRMALLVFLVGGAIRSLRGDRKHHAMLVHTSGMRQSHTVVSKRISAIVDYWRGVLELPSDDPGTRDFIKLVQQALDDLRMTVGSCPSFTSVYAQLRTEVEQLKVWMVNSLPQGLNPTTEPIRLKNNIMIGGNMLDRGVTIDGLAVTYVTRTSKVKQADTVEQRARWFGYKMGYLDVCRLYMTKDTVETFSLLQLHEDDFWAALRRNAMQGVPLKEWPRLLRLGLNIKPTRSNVASTRTFAGTGWTIETLVETERHVCRANLAVIESFRSSHKWSDMRIGTVHHQIVRKCNSQEVIDELLLKLVRSNASNWDSLYIVEYLQRLVLAGKLPTLNVVLMNGGNERKRTPIAGNRINPMQGSNRKPSDPDYYPGDEHFHGGEVQLQIHIVRLGQPDILTSALALYVPETDRYDIGRLVVPSD